MKDEVLFKPRNELKELELIKRIKLVKASYNELGPEVFKYYQDSKQRYEYLKLLASVFKTDGY